MLGSTCFVASPHVGQASSLSPTTRTRPACNVQVRSLAPRRRRPPERVCGRRIEDASQGDFVLLLEQHSETLVQHAKQCVTGLPSHRHLAQRANQAHLDALSVAADPARCYRRWVDGPGRRRLTDVATEVFFRPARTMCVCSGPSCLATACQVASAPLTSGTCRGEMSPTSTIAGVKPIESPVC